MQNFTSQLEGPRSYITPWGRAMLANNMNLSRFRYWVQVMHVPTETAQSMASDVQALTNLEQRLRVQQRGKLH